MIGKAPAERPPARSFHLFGSARAAFGYWLAGAPSVERDVILLPAYIGWSSREGSGVFDPIAASGLRPRFYRLTPDLAIDIDSLRAHLVRADVAVLLLIHYFGHVDPACSTAVRLAREAGVQIVEDAAHAMLSDLIGGTCGRQGDATLYSLHKMVPATGGVLVRNRAATSTSDALPAIWRHDLAAIAVRRRRNAAYLQLQLRDLADEVEILWPNLAEGEIPQYQWSAEGRALTYLNRPADPKKLVAIREIVPETQKDLRIADTSQFARFSANADGTVFVGASGSKASPYVLLLARAVKREFTLAEHKASDSRMVAPLFTPNSQGLVFQSDRHGKPAIYWMAVEKFVAKTEGS